MNEDYYLQLQIHELQSHAIKIFGFYTFNMAVSQDYGVLINMESCKPEQYRHLLGKAATLAIHPQGIHSNKQPHFFSGVITRIEDAQLIMRSPLHPLKHQKQSRTYQYVDLYKLSELILKKYKWLKGHDYEIVLNKHHEAAPLINKRFLQQRDQSDYDFFTDTLARLGGFFIFEQTEDLAQLKIYVDPKQLIEQQQGVRLPLISWQGGERQYGTVYSFAQHAFLLPATVSSLDYHTTSAQLLAVDNVALENSANRREPHHSTPAGDGKKVFYTDNYQTQAQGAQVVCFHQQALDWQRQLITIYTDDLSLSPGRILELIPARSVKRFCAPQAYQVLAVDLATARTGEVQAQQNKHISHWLPTVVEYNPHSLPAFYQQLNQQCHQLPTSGLHARVWLIPLATPYRTPIVDYHDQGACFQRAVITAPAESELPEQNAYYIRYDYDTSEAIKESPSSLPVRLRQPFTAPASGGAHFSLLPGTPVLMGHLYNNLEQPVMLGVLPTPKHTGSGCDLYYQQHKITTQSGHQLLLQDDEHSPQITLATADAAQQLLLDATPEEHAVSLNQKTGVIELAAAQAFLEQTEGNYVLSAAENYHVTVKGAHQLSAPQLFWSAKQDLKHNAENNIRFSVDQGGLQLAAANDLLIDAADDLMANVQTDDFNLQIEKGDLVLHAAQAINLTAESGASDIEIKQGATYLKLSAKGELIIDAPHIVFKADKVVFTGVTDLAAITLNEDA